MLVSAPVETEPERSELATDPPDTDTLVQPLVVQSRVEEPPDEILPGVAVKESMLQSTETVIDLDAGVVPSVASRTYVIVLAIGPVEAEPNKRVLNVVVGPELVRRVELVQFEVPHESIDDPPEETLGGVASRESIVQGGVVPPVTVMVTVRSIGAEELSLASNV